MLATLSSESGSMPVLAVQPVDNGRTAVFTGDTTRKWQQGPRAMDQDSPFLRFWGQMVRWLAGRSEAVEAKSGVVASWIRDITSPRKRCGFRPWSATRTGKAPTTPRYRSRSKDPAGKPDQVDLSPQPGPAGHYGGTFDPKAAGTL